MIEEGVAASPVPAAGRRRPLTRFLSWEGLLGLVLAAAFAAGAFASPYFLDIWNLSDATFNFTEKAIVALPMAMLIIGGEIDISVAGIIALASVMMGLAAAAGANTTLVAFAGLGTGLVCGLANGALVTVFDVPSIVATIGTMSLYRGIGYSILGDQVMKSYPPGFDSFGQGYLIGPLSYEFALFLLLALSFGIVLHFTTIGRRLYALGLNPIAARFSGVAVGRTRFLLFALVGLMSGLASVCLTSRLSSTRPSIAVGWELEIITMVVLGGVAITGGSGSILGVVLAALLMGLVTFGLGLLNVPGIVMQVVVGGMLIFVIAIPAVLKRLSNRR